MVKPNLFIVGFPKCGTSALASRLSKHSSIFLPKLKELQYFDSEFYSSNLNGPGDGKPIINNLNDYLEEYKGRKETYLIDATPSYILEDQVANEIYKFNSSARVIIMIRNPAERAFSNYAHLVRDQREELSFDNALKAEKERSDKNWSSFWRYKDSSFYYKRIKNYIDTFGSKNVFVITTEELKQKQKKIIDETIAWLGLDREDIYSNVTYNKSGLPNSSLKLVNIFKKNSLIKWVGKKIISKESFERFKSKNLIPMKIEKNSYELLKKEFENDIKMLEKLLDRDLSLWYKG